MRPSGDSRREHSVIRHHPSFTTSHFIPWTPLPARYGNQLQGLPRFSLGSSLNNLWLEVSALCTVLAMTLDRIRPLDACHAWSMAFSLPWHTSVGSEHLRRRCSTCSSSCAPSVGTPSTGLFSPVDQPPSSLPPMSSPPGQPLVLLVLLSVGYPLVCSHSRP